MIMVRSVVVGWLNTDLTHTSEDSALCTDMSHLDSQRYCNVVFVEELKYVNSKIYVSRKFVCIQYVNLLHLLLIYHSSRKDARNDHQMKT